jgi:Fis family transcriptional regulator, factor for inversion stimulation protein
MKKQQECILDENEVARYVRQAVDEYFKNLDGEDPSCSVHEMVMSCVEKPLIETVMHYAEGNQTRAAELLGLNRNTLRKKLGLFAKQKAASGLRPATRPAIRPERHTAKKSAPAHLNGKRR